MSQFHADCNIQGALPRPVTTQLKSVVFQSLQFQVILQLVSSFFGCFAIPMICVHVFRVQSKAEHTSHLWLVVHKIYLYIKNAHKLLQRTEFSMVCYVSFLFVNTSEN